MAAQLRVFSPTMDTDVEDTQDPSINIRLGDLLPIIAYARRNNYLWLQDFLEDEVTVTSDLYDVIRSFYSAQRPSA